uniref:OSIGBa0107A02.4 protein n=1 Tax=Oryza sativa TaxID=4530 RepID=Q01MH2_ORYSA|nr:OSIGBa0107A02.4 [Oryza sativa]
MAEKQPPPPSSPGSVKEKMLKLGLTDVNEGNVVPVDPEKFTPEQKKEFEAMLQQAQDQFLNSFMQTRKGTLVQKYKIKVVADDPRTSSSKDGDGKQALDGSAQPSIKGATDGSLGNQGHNSQGVHGVQGDGVHGVQGDGAQGLQGGNPNSDVAQDFFNNFQDRVDYAVHHALINQSGVLVNTLSNMMKSIADGSIAGHQAAGQAVPSITPATQPTAPASTPLPATSAMAPGQSMNPRLLMREHPQHSGQVANRPTQDQVAAMFLPPQHAVDPIRQQPIQQQSIQQTPQIQQVVQPIQQQVMQPVQQTPPRQQPLQPIQQTPLRQQIVQPIQHQGSVSASAGFATPGGQPVQQLLNQVVLEHLVHHIQPYGTVMPQVVPEHLLRNIQPNLHNYQGGNLSYQYQPPSPQAQYQPGGLVQPQFASQYGQFEPMQQQSQGAAQQRPWADVIADVMREQFGLKPKETGSLYRQSYPEWFERVPLPNRFKVPDFSKFSGQDGVSTYEHISRFLAQCGEASALGRFGEAIHSYFYSGVHEIKLSDLTAIKQRHDEPVHEYIQRFREMRNKCFSLSLTDAQLADLAFQGMIAPIREKFSSEDFDSLSHLIQKVTLHEHRSAEVRKSSKRVNHVCPYMYGSDDDEDDPEIAAAEWVFRQQIQVAIEGGKIRFDDSKKPMKIDGNPFPVNMVHIAGQTTDRARARGFQVNSAKIINKYQRKYDKQQEKHYEEYDDGFDPYWGCEFFRFCWNEGMRLPSIENCLGCSDIIKSSSRSYNRGNRLRQTRVSVHQRLGPVNQDHGQEDSVVKKNQWCPSAEFGIGQADVDEVEEESAKLVLSLEQAVFEKPEGTENWHLKPLYINDYVNGKPMSKMMVDSGAAVNLMPYATFRKLGRNAEDLIKTNMVLKDFSGNPSETKGVLNVEVTVGSKTIPTTFFVIDGKGSYSLLLGRDRIHANCCIPSTMHQCLIQWQGDKIEIVPADSQLKMENPSYYFEGVVEGASVYTKDIVDDLDDKQGQGFMSADDLEEIDIGPGDRPRPTFISKNLSPEFRTKLIELLKEFRDCFAWEYYEMPRLSRSIVEHRLPIKPGVRPLHQPPRRCKADMLEPVKAEIKRLYDAGFIRPCRYAEWVSSIVPVIKKNGKSAGATYQRAMNYIYHDLIGWLVEVYIDDVVVKSKEIEDHITDLRKVFERTGKYGLKMNPTKCAFGVSAGQFLGFLVHERGIEVTQRSVNAIKKIQPTENKTELQEMIGKINFVRRFISNLSRRLEPFTPLLRLKADQQFTWGAEQQKALDDIKEYLSSPPVLIPPQKGIPFRLYLSAAQGASGYKPMIKDVKVKIAAMTANDWRYDVHRYLSNPSQSASRKLRYKALKYTLLDDELYYRTIDGVLLKCLSADQAKVAIGEVHEGMCGTHQSAHKIKWLLWRVGYFWLTMMEDCFRYYKGCQDCQKFGAIQRAPASAMNPIIKPWPFRGWEIDMIGMINPPSSKGHKFILVATDYFTKWVEAIPLKKVDSGHAIRFV